MAGELLIYRRLLRNRSDLAGGSGIWSHQGSGMLIFEILSLPGPASDFAANITSAGGRTIICAGGTDDTRTKPGRPFQVSVHEDGEFFRHCSRWPEVMPLNHSSIRIIATISLLHHMETDCWNSITIPLPGNSMLAIHLNWQ